MRVPFLALAVAALYGCAAESVAVGGSVDVERVPASDARTGLRTYAAKFLCGTIPAESSNLEFPSLQGSRSLTATFGATAEVLAPGTYLSAINIHNPNTTTIEFAKKALETIPQRELPDAIEERPPLPRRMREVLRADEGVEVDCIDILRLLAQRQATTDVAATPVFQMDELVRALQTNFVKGFVILESELALDVVGVYSFKNVELRNSRAASPADTL
ncbi:MAG: hypothetical protein GTO22_27640 [Gemmatimonadales bacterium]|nr:hypothetical protein [Gemmatimonadales bacterium]